MDGEISFSLTTLAKNAAVRSQCNCTVATVYCSNDARWPWRLTHGNCPCVFKPSYVWYVTFTSTTKQGHNCSARGGGYDNKLCKTGKVGVRFTSACVLTFALMRVLLLC